MNIPGGSLNVLEQKVSVRSGRCVSKKLLLFNVRSALRQLEALSKEIADLASHGYCRIEENGSKTRVDV